MKVLNLYAGIGGNRKRWTACDVTAVEKDPQIAVIYQDFFPGDRVLVEDAHDYLLQHYTEYDFIWSSPPCPSHSTIRKMGIQTQGNVPLYPDMSLYQEIIFLQHHALCLWCVENVIPYYTPLILPTQKLGRHYFWSNFFIPPKKCKQSKVWKGNLRQRQNDTEFDLAQYNLRGYRKDQILRNCVLPEIGLWIFVHRDTFRQLTFI